MCLVDTPRMTTVTQSWSIVTIPPRRDGRTWARCPDQTMTSVHVCCVCHHTSDCKTYLVTYTNTTVVMVTLLQVLKVHGKWVGHI